MNLKRLPKFRSHSSVRTIDFTERDHAIVRSVHRHRFLRSSHIAALIPGSRQVILRRLQLLYHHGYLERPRCQIDYYHAGGSREIVYGLGSKGGSLLRREGITVQNDWGEKNRGVKRMFLEHALMVSDFVVAIEISCQNAGVRFLSQADLKLPRTLRWRVKLNGKTTLAVMPDRAFALEYRNRSGELARANFFVEADRGTMPVIRRNLSQTSLYRKILAYEATWKQEFHKKLIGFRRFRVLTITTSAARQSNLLSACTSLKSGHRLFLFADKSSLHKPQAIFSTDWKNAAGETVRLLE